MTLNFGKVGAKFGEEGRRYAYVDAGLATENVLLQVQAMGLGACVIGGFDGAKVSRLLQLPGDQEPVLLVTVGYSS